jgi:hypothetical protein
LDRRTFIASSGAPPPLPRCFRVPSSPSRAPAPATPRSTRCSSASSSRMCSIRPSRRPRWASTKARNAALKGRLAPRTLAERARQLAQTKAALAELAAVDRSTLSPAAKLNLEVVTYSLTNQTSRRSASASTARSGPTGSSSRAAPISRCPTSSTRRIRSQTRRMPRPICRGSRRSRWRSTRTARCSGSRRRGAMSRRPGRST